MQERIERIRRMESLFDEVRAVQKIDGTTRESIRELEEYMDSGQWLEDYGSDESGLLPADLKRGVLSQDGLYNLLADIREKEKKK